MKLSLCTIVLSSLLFFTHNSYADINIKKCQPNNSSYIFFDEIDSEKVEKLINYQLHDQPEKRESSVIKIFTNENADDRNYWIASFKSDNQSEQYLFYQVDQDKIIKIDHKQFQTLLPKIIACNLNKQVPLYSENFDAD
ncbi:hypothetical protein A9G13_04055 [Gilliamella sp. wkB178]|uniref:hypothetical protein n=1 Tax=Gilliamella sp. wkB178 TaxID=3120259 RepID=UPI00080E87FE|nr:hypothetical protein [Gilliamella apicola]OCG07424.1 hypothetical protein A9G13_04055 [Gilliamella apicola]